MKVLTTSLVAAAVIASLAGCSGDDPAPDVQPAPSSAPTEKAESPAEPAEPAGPAEPDAELAEDRFQVTFTYLADLFEVISAQTDVDPTSTEEANAAAGLDETTPLVFVDYSPIPEDEGAVSACLASSSTGTYVAFTFTSGLSEVDMGDGECSYETADAEVVGSLDDNEWVTGADLMGPFTPVDFLGVDTP